MKTVRKVRRVIRQGELTAGMTDGFAAKLDAITKQIERIGKTTPGQLARNLVSPEFHHLLGMTSREISTMVSGMTVVGRLMLVEALATELRRINAIAADGKDPINGPNANADLSWGESGHVSKELGLPGAASITDVQAAADAVAFVLEVAVAAHEDLTRNASVRDGEISDPRGSDGLPLSRGHVMNLDALSKYADRQNAINAKLLSQTDWEGGLGISKASREANAQVAKSAGQGLPADSYAGSNSQWWMNFRRP